MKLRMLSLCAGIGGADFAAEATDAIEVVGQVEIDPFCQAVLAKHWPHVPRMGNIKEVRGHEFGPVDILVAGFPCQPHSLAGERRASADERDLWPEIKRLIGAAQPRWFVGENVPGLLSSDDGRFYGDILADLDALGYRVGWCVYGASEVGAPHQRDRVFMVAHAPSREDRRGEQRGIQSNTLSSGVGQADANGHRRRQWAHQQKQISQCCDTPDACHDGAQRLMADPGSAGWQELDAAAITAGTGHAARRTSAPGSVADPEYGRCEGWCERADQSGTTLLCGRAASGPAPQPGMGRDFARLPRGLDRHRWPVGPGEEQAEWEPPRTITGSLPNRARRLKALGNAIVPQQMYPIFAAIVAMEEN